MLLITRFSQHPIQATKVTKTFSVRKSKEDTIRIQKYLLRICLLISFEESSQFWKKLKQTETTTI